MTQAGVKLEHSGRAVLPACTRELGAIGGRGARIGSRLISPAGAVGASPRNLRRSGGLGRFALGRNGPVGIACVLVGAHSPADPHGDPDPERLVDPKKAPHDDLRELLEEKARLDREYDRLFLRALAFGVPPLTLFDDSKGGRAPIYVCDYIDDLQASRADNTWMASSCTWQGSATLYEVTQPRSRGEDEVGRRLCLPRQANVDSRADLAAIAPEALCYPPGKGPADFPGQPWVPKAAEASY